MDDQTIKVVIGNDIIEFIITFSNDNAMRLSLPKKIELPRLMKRSDLIESRLSKYVGKAKDFLKLNVQISSLIKSIMNKNGDIKHIHVDKLDASEALWTNLNGSEGRAVAYCNKVDKSTPDEVILCRRDSEFIQQICPQYYEASTSHNEFSLLFLDRKLSVLDFLSEMLFQYSVTDTSDKITSTISEISTSNQNMHIQEVSINLERKSEAEFCDSTVEREEIKASTIDSMTLPTPVKPSNEMSSPEPEYYFPNDSNIGDESSENTTNEIARQFTYAVSSESEDIATIVQQNASYSSSSISRSVPPPPSSTSTSRIKKRPRPLDTDILPDYDDLPPDSSPSSFSNIPDSRKSPNNNNNNNNHRNKVDVKTDSKVTTDNRIRAGKSSTVKNCIWYHLCGPNRLPICCQLPPVICQKVFSHEKPVVGSDDWYTLRFDLYHASTKINRLKTGVDSSFPTPYLGLGQKFGERVPLLKETVRVVSYCFFSFTNEITDLKRKSRNKAKVCEHCLGLRHHELPVKDSVEWYGLRKYMVKELNSFNNSKGYTPWPDFGLVFNKTILLWQEFENASATLSQLYSTPKQAQLQLRSTLPLPSINVTSIGNHSQADSNCNFPSSVNVVHNDKTNTSENTKSSASNSLATTSKSMARTTTITSAKSTKAMDNSVITTTKKMKLSPVVKEVDLKSNRKRDISVLNIDSSSNKSGNDRISSVDSTSTNNNKNEPTKKVKTVNSLRFKPVPSSFFSSPSSLSFTLKNKRCIHFHSTNQQHSSTSICPPDCPYIHERPLIGSTEWYELRCNLYERYRKELLSPLIRPSAYLGLGKKYGEIIPQNDNERKSTVSPSDIYTHESTVDYCTDFFSTDGCSLGDNCNYCHDLPVFGSFQWRRLCNSFHHCLFVNMPVKDLRLDYYLDKLRQGEKCPFEKAYSSSSNDRSSNDTRQHLTGYEKGTDYKTNDFSGDRFISIGDCVDKISSVRYDDRGSRLYHHNSSFGNGSSSLKVIGDRSDFDDNNKRVNDEGSTRKTVPSHTSFNDNYKDENINKSPNKTTNLPINLRKSHNNSNNNNETSIATPMKSIFNITETKPTSEGVMLNNSSSTNTNIVSPLSDLCKTNQKQIDSSNSSIESARSAQANGDFVYNNSLQHSTEQEFINHINRFNGNNIDKNNNENSNSSDNNTYGFPVSNSPPNARLNLSKVYRDTKHDDDDEEDDDFTQNSDCTAMNNFDKLIARKQSESNKTNTSITITNSSVSNSNSDKAVSAVSNNEICNNLGGIQDAQTLRENWRQSVYDFLIGLPNQSSPVSIRLIAKLFPSPEGSDLVMTQVLLMADSHRPNRFKLCCNEDDESEATVKLSRQVLRDLFPIADEKCANEITTFVNDFQLNVSSGNDSECSHDSNNSDDISSSVIDNHNNNNNHKTSEFDITNAINSWRSSIYTWLLKQSGPARLDEIGNNVLRPNLLKSTDTQVFDRTHKLSYILSSDPRKRFVYSGNRDNIRVTVARKHKKIPLCRFYKSGFCRDGDDCKFSHSS